MDDEDARDSKCRPSDFLSEKMVRELTPDSTKVCGGETEETAEAGKGAKRASQILSLNKKKLQFRFYFMLFLASFSFLSGWKKIMKAGAHCALEHNFIFYALSQRVCVLDGELC